MDFKSPYNRKHYIDFFKNQFLPEDFIEYDEKISLSFSPQFIKSVIKIGEVSSLDLNIYEVEHLSENDPRVSLSRESFRLLSQYSVKRALVLFTSKKSENYRLSLVTIDLKWEEGRRVQKEYSNPRRYSFFLGSDAKVHTPSDFLIKKGRVKDVVDLVSRFDVEIVTREFFTKYKGLYEDVKKYLEKDYAFKNFASRNNIDIDTFAKKLLGQIVFCYFLQRKGWLGAKESEPIDKGDKDFMRSLFNCSVPEGKNFYNNYLEHLFYDSFNNKPEEPQDFYRPYFKCQIPFLNGGLFEPIQDYDWRKSFIHIPDKTFSNKEKTGILDIFDLYNFTVYEDDPIDREISVDPEMLGKVFENLLPENLRKGQGAYYTPREIVHYMCQESLINHLATETNVDIEKIRKLITFKNNIVTREDYIESINNSDARHKISEEIVMLSKNEIELLDRALANIKICDPACGSGAFLVGMLNEIVRARRILEEGAEYKLKKETIQNCIYGVDIDPGAVEIAKLRLWLSLVVDYEHKDIEPLPNLDYKVMCGNSLLEELIVGEESITLFDEKLLNLPKNSKQKKGLFDDDAFEGKRGTNRNEYLQNLLKTKQKQLFDLNYRNQLSQEKKQELKEEILTINKELNPKSKKVKSVDIHPTLFVEKAERYFNILKELHTQYFAEYDPTKKKEKRKQIEDIELEFIKSSIKEKVDGIETRMKNLNMQNPNDRKKQIGLMKKKLEYIAIPDQIHNSKVKPYFLWKLNFCEVFQDKGGFDVVIANPPYVSVKEIKPIDKKAFNQIFETGQGRFNLFTLFLEKGNKILRTKGILTFILPEGLYSNVEYQYIRKYLIENSTILFINLFTKRVFDAAVDTSIISTINDRTAIGEFPVIRDLKEEITILRQDLFKELPFFLYTVNLDNDSKNIVFRILNSKTETISNILEIQQGIIYSGQPKEKVFANEKKTEKYKKVLDGRDALKWLINWKNKRDNRFIHYTNKLHRAREERLFLAKEKILLPRKSMQIYCAYDDEQYFCLNTAYVCLLKNDNYKLRFILAILNSKLINYCYSKLFFGWQITIPALNCIGIPDIQLSKQDEFIVIVDKILSITKSADYLTNSLKLDKVKEYEDQINQMVYKLYGLTKEEIKIVEDSSKE